MVLEILLLLLNPIVDSLVHRNKINNNSRELVPPILVATQFYIQMASKFSEVKTTRNFKTDKKRKITNVVISQRIKLIIKILLTAVL